MGSSRVNVRVQGSHGWNGIAMHAATQPSLHVCSSAESLRIGPSRSQTVEEWFARISMDFLDDAGSFCANSCRATDKVSLCLQRVDLHVASLQNQIKEIDRRLFGHHEPDRRKVLSHASHEGYGPDDFSLSNVRQYRRQFSARTCQGWKTIAEEVEGEGEEENAVALQASDINWLRRALRFDRFLPSGVICGYLGLILSKGPSSKVMHFSLGKHSFTILLGHVPNACVDPVTFSSSLGNALSMKVESLTMSDVGTGDLLVIPASSTLLVRTEVEAMRWIAMAPD